MAGLRVLGRGGWGGLGRGPPLPPPHTPPHPPQQEHTEILHSLRFTLVFVQHVLEIAALRGSASDTAGGPESQLQESVVADQISLLSREWGCVGPAGPGQGGRGWPGLQAPAPPNVSAAPQLRGAAGAIPEGGRAAVLGPADRHRPDPGRQAVPVIHREAG